MNEVGLKQENITILISSLNILLATQQIIFQNLRGFHWNIVGKNFFDLHKKFQDLYEKSYSDSDDIAERIRSLGGTPLHTYEDYISKSKVASVKNVSNENEAMSSVISGLENIIKQERLIAKISDNYIDEATNVMVTDFIRNNEKDLWMLKAWSK